MLNHHHCFLYILWILVAILTSYATGGTSSNQGRGPPRISNRDLKPLQVVRLGQEFRASCPVEGDNVMVDWHKDGESITPAWSRIRINPRGLRIRQVVFEDAGIYQCKGVNGFGSQIARIRLVVAEKSSDDSEESESIMRKRHQDSSKSKSVPAFTQETLEQAGPMHLSAGNTIRFRCETKEPAKVVWLKDGKAIGEKRTSWTLILNKLASSDTGNYSCINVGSNESVNIQLLVTELVGEEHKPEVELPQSNNTSVLSGHEAVLECMVQASGHIMRPHIKWLKQLPKDQPPPSRPTGKHKHRLLSVDNQFFLVIQETDDDSIRINETEQNASILSKLIFARTEPDDDATYLCLATNNFGYTYKEAKLTVLVGAEIMSSSSSLIPFPLIVIGMSLVVAVVVIGAACSLRRHQDHLPKQTKSMSPRQLSNPSIDYYKGFEQRQLLVSTSTHSSSTSSGGGGGGCSGGTGGEKMVRQTKLVSPGVAMAISRCSCCAQQQKTQEISALQSYDQCFNNSYVGSSTSHSLHCGHWT